MLFDAARIAFSFPEKIFHLPLFFFILSMYNIACSGIQLKIGPLAQLVEHLTLNQGVQGSSP